MFSADLDYWAWKGKLQEIFLLKVPILSYASGSKDDRAGEHNSGFWKKLWQLKIPPKIKKFEWRAVNGCLPTRVQLRQKNVEASHIFPMRGIHSETISHILVSCAFATSCWFYAGLSTGVNIPDSFGAWLASFFELNDVEKACEAAGLCWTIWKARNELIWNQKSLSIEEVKTLSGVTLFQWRKAQNKENLPHSGLCTNVDGAESWTKPYTNTIKVNVDAAIFGRMECMQSVRLLIVIQVRLLKLDVRAIMGAWMLEQQKQWG